MTGRFIGIRWWLGAAFALVAAVSTAIVVAQFSSRSQNALRAHAAQEAAQSAALAAKEPSLARAARFQDLELRLYNRAGRLFESASPVQGTVRDPSLESEARQAALAGRHFRGSTHDGSVYVIGLPTDRGALVALSHRPDVAAAIGIQNDQALRAGVIAGVIGVLVGLVLAQLIAEGDALPDPWQSFSLREFAAGLFDSHASSAQAHVRADDERALALVGIPAQPEGDTVLIVLEDLTEQERRELAEREFVSNAAHELRTPLTTIIGAVEVLQAGAKDDPAQRDRFLAHIEREGARLARLARALLTLARSHSGQERPRVEAVPLGELLQEVADDLRQLEGVAVEVDCPPELLASVNRDLLEQVLRNLGENAAKYTPSGRVVLRAYTQGTSLLVEVEDSGVGMTAETQQHVFDRFYRGQGRDAEGFGLGLAIAREAVRSLDGHLQLDSAPGEGTRVRIVLERVRAHEEVPAA